MSEPKKPRGKWSKRLARLALVLVGSAIIASVASWWIMVRMPGDSYEASLSPLSKPEEASSYLLREDVIALATTIGERNHQRPDALKRAADYIEREFRIAGYVPRREPVRTGGVFFDNLEVERLGTENPELIIVIGAHYDSAVGSPGANDNGTGVAALLELSRRFSETSTKRTLRFVAFTNEEPPHFKTERMGSLVYAQGCAARGEQVAAMLSLETMGYFSTDAGSQKYPAPLSLFYPDRGDFIGVVGDIDSGPFVREVVARFREHGRFPSEGAAMPSALPGISWSDHWSFWQQGVPGAMVTDTAPFRYPHYHTGEDTPDKVDFDRLARVVSGLTSVVAALSNDAPLEH